MWASVFWEMVWQKQRRKFYQQSGRSQGGDSISTFEAVRRNPGPFCSKTNADLVWKMHTPFTESSAILRKIAFNGRIKWCVERRIFTWTWIKILFETTDILRSIVSSTIWDTHDTMQKRLWGTWHSNLDCKDLGMLAFTANFRKFFPFLPQQ